MKIVFILVMPVAFYIAGCTAKSNDSKKSNEAELPVLAIAPRDTMLQRTYVATINACQNIELRAKAGGYLEKVLVDEGEFVKKGQVLFVLNDDEFNVQVSEAAALLANNLADVQTAEVEMQRVKTLVEKNVLTASELDLAKAKLAAANARVQEAKAKEEKARIRLSYTAVRAPFNGIINRIPHKTGSLIADGTLLTTLSDIHSMHAYFNVSEGEYLNYVKNDQLKSKTGQPVTLILADGSIYPQTGKIEVVEGEFEPATGSIAFRADFPNPSKLLKHGASGKVLLRSAIRSAVLIPQRSVMEIQDKNYVFVLGDDNTVKMRSIESGGQLEDLILVKSGLASGDRILYEGTQNIREGNKIKPRLLTLNSLIAIKAD